MAHASDPNGLLVITQVQPISVIFTIAEDRLAIVVKKLSPATCSVKHGCN
jgi:multidrug efflux system membrane fusion protein